MSGCRARLHLFLKERSMYSFEVPSWKVFDEEEFDRGIYLWVLHADKVPPHIGISKEGEYFSLKATGKDIAVPVRKILQLLKQKSIPALILKTSPNSIMPVDLAEVFGRYIKAGLGQATCLTPITEIYFSGQQDLILSELLNLLNESGTLEEVFGLNLDQNFKGIPHYERKDIQKHLTGLSHVKGRKNSTEGH